VSCTLSFWSYDVVHSYQLIIDAGARVELRRQNSMNYFCQILITPETWLFYALHLSIQSITC